MTEARREISEADHQTASVALAEKSDAYDAQSAPVGCGMGGGSPGGGRPGDEFDNGVAVPNRPR